MYMCTAKCVCVCVCVLCVIVHVLGESAFPLLYTVFKLLFFVVTKDTRKRKWHLRLRLLEKE